MSEEVKRFVCPEVSLPSQPKKTSEPRGSGRSVANKTNEREEFQAMRRAVTEFRKSSLTGLSRANHKADKLTTLGVPAPPVQKMPFRMRIGIEKGREKRAEKATKSNKLSGKVEASSLKVQRVDSKSNHDRAQNFGLKTSRGVLHLERNKLPSKLVKGREVGKNSNKNFSRNKNRSKF